MSHHNPQPLDDDPRPDLPCEFVQREKCPADFFRGREFLCREKPAFKIRKGHENHVFDPMAFQVHEHRFLSGDTLTASVTIQRILGGAAGLGLVKFSSKWVA
jgi:hypothetical protein